MPVETLKDALSAGWRVHARCIDGQVDYTRSKAKCRYQAELNLETLVSVSLQGTKRRLVAGDTNVGSS